MRVEERFRRRDYGHLELTITITDPQTFTRPITFSVVEELLPDTDLFEHYCLENEKDDAAFSGQSAEIEERKTDAHHIHPGSRVCHRRARGGATLFQRRPLRGEVLRRRGDARQAVRASLLVQERRHRLDRGARGAGDGRHAAALPRHRRDHAGGGVRSQPAGSLESALLHDRQRRPRRRCARPADQSRSHVGADERLRDGAHQHRPRRAQGAERVVHSQQPAEGDRLRVSRGARDGRNREEDRHGYYAKSITFSYWNSCSNGGRQGLLEAQRYPDDFDGIVANAPWVDQTGFTIGAIWNQKALTEAPVSLDEDEHGRREGDGQVRRGGRPEGRAHRRPAQVQLRSGARRAGLQRRRRRGRLSDRRAGGDAEEDLRRPGQQRQAALPGLHGGQRSGDRRSERRDGHDMGQCDRGGAAERQAGRLQSGGRRDALPGARSAAAGIRHADVRLRSRSGRSSRGGASWPTRRTPTCRSSARAAAN